MKNSLKSLATQAGNTLKEHPEYVTAPAGALAGGYLANKATGNPLMTAGSAAGGAGLAYALTDVLKHQTPGVLAKDLKPESTSNAVEDFAESPIMTTVGTAASALPSAALTGAQLTGLSAIPGYGLYRLKELLRRKGVFDKVVDETGKAKKPTGVLGGIKGFVTGNEHIWNPIQASGINPIAQKAHRVVKASAIPEGVKKVLRAVIGSGIIKAK